MGLLASATLVVAASPCLAFDRIQHTIEGGYEIYTGLPAVDNLRPDFAVRASLATRYDFWEAFALVGRFTGNFFLSNAPFSSLPSGAYFGMSIGYNPSFRLKAGSEGVVPYIEGGGIASLYFASLQGAGATVAPNQLALKLGYTAGIGLDFFLKDSGLGGFGFGVSYFSTFIGPGFIDFPIGAVGFSGFRADLHVNLPI